MKGSKFLLLFLLVMCTLFNQAYAQTIPSKLAEQVKRNANKSEHVTAFYKGKIERILYGGFSQSDALNGIIFKKSDGKLIKLWIYPSEGINVRPFLPTGEEIEVKVSGDPVLLERAPYKDSSTKKLEKDLKAKISGIGYLSKVTTSEGSYDLNITSSQKKSTYESTYETRLGVEVLEVIKLKNRRGLFILKNGDSLESYSLNATKKYIQDNKVSYLRPSRKVRAGYFYKTSNTFQMTAGNLIMSGNTISRVPVLNQRGTFVDQMSGLYVGSLNDKRGLVNGMNVFTDNDTMPFLFSSKNAKEVRSFISNGEPLRLFYKALTPDGHAKNEKDNVLYAICSSTDTLYTDDYYSFVNSNNHYNEETTSYEGVITRIHYPDKVNKTSILRVSQTRETGFRSMLIDNKVYLQIRDVLALSIAQFVSEGKTISFEGWTRKDLPEEINELGYTIMIPSKITIDGKTFANQVDLKTAL